MIIPFFHGSKDKHPASGMAADALFQSTFEHAPIGLAVVSLSGEFKQVNPAICEILGHTEAELLATNFVRITHPSDIDADMGWISRLLTGELDRYHMDKRYIRADGSTVWTRLAVSLMRNAEQQPVNFISVVEDISDVASRNVD